MAARSLRPGHRSKHGLQTRRVAIAYRVARVFAAGHRRRLGPEERCSSGPGHRCQLVYVGAGRVRRVRAANAATSRRGQQRLVADLTGAGAVGLFIVVWFVLPGLLNRRVRLPVPTRRPKVRCRIDG